MSPPVDPFRNLNFYVKSCAAFSNWTQFQDPQVSFLTANWWKFDLIPWAISLKSIQKKDDVNWLGVARTYRPYFWCSKCRQRMHQKCFQLFHSLWTLLFLLLFTVDCYILGSLCNLSNVFLRIKGRCQIAYIIELEHVLQKVPQLTIVRKNEHFHIYV